MRKNTKALLVSVLSLALFFSGFELCLAYEKEIKVLSSTLAESIVTSGKKSIAVVDFTDLQGNVTELGRFLAEEFSVALSEASKGFEVVDRTHLKSLLKEHQLAQTGLIDPQTARKLGEIAGVQALVTGTLTPFGDSIRLSVKVLDTATAKVIGASRGDIAKTKGIDELLSRGIPETITAAPSTGKTTPPPAKPKAVSKVEVGDFTFEAKQCVISGQKVICTIAVVNNALNVRFGVYFTGGRSILVDELGNQYKSFAAWFGGMGGEGSPMSQYVAQLLQTVPTGLPMNLVLEYRDVVTTARYVNVVVDFCYDRGGFKEEKAVIRNIPLVR